MDHQVAYLLGFLVLTIVAMVFSVSVNIPRHEGSKEYPGTDMKVQHPGNFVDKTMLSRQTDTPVDVPIPAISIDDFNNKLKFKGLDFSSSTAFGTTTDPIVVTLSGPFVGNNAGYYILERDDYPWSRTENLNLINLANNTQFRSDSTKNIAKISGMGPLFLENYRTNKPPKYNVIVTKDNIQTFRLFHKNANEKQAILVKVDDFSEIADTVINKLEYYGLTSTGLWPVPRPKPYIIRDSFQPYYHGSDDVSTLLKVDQALQPQEGNPSNDSINLGLFAKVHTSRTPPLNATDFKGFKNDSTVKQKIIELKHFGPSPVINDSHWETDNTDGTPHYTIGYINIDEKEKFSSIMSHNTYRNTQNVVILTGSKRNDSADFSNITERSGNVTKDKINFVKDKYYHPGDEVLYCIIFFKFNTTTNKSTQKIEIAWDSNGIPYAQNIENTGIRSIICVNYYGLYDPLRRTDYENFYHWDGNNYTWYYDYNTTTNSWVSSI
jgi:hypothetical protein